MTMTNFYRISIFFLLGGVLACSDTAPEASGAAHQDRPVSAAAASGQKAGTVLETMDSGGYTYVQLDLGGEQVWAAGPPTEIAVGDTVTLMGEIPMKDFYSKTLDRTFGTIYFAAGLQKGSVDVQSVERSSAGPHGSPSAVEPVEPGEIPKAEGGSTVAELFVNRDILVGKEVAIRGRVTKFNPGIMNRNWLHLQDGTGVEGNRDITVTTQDSASVGDVVLVKGTLVADQDFGYGYSYDLLIEKAQITSQ